MSLTENGTHTHPTCCANTVPSMRFCDDDGNQVLRQHWILWLWMAGRMFMVLKNADFSVHEEAECLYCVKETKVAITDVVLGCSVGWGQRKVKCLIHIYKYTVIHFNVLGQCVGLLTQLKMKVSSTPLQPLLPRVTLQILFSKHSYLLGEELCNFLSYTFIFKKF